MLSKLVPPVSEFELAQSDLPDQRFSRIECKQSAVFTA